MGRLKIKKKIPKPKFKTLEQSNEYYMRHCWTCRKPLPDDMVRELEGVKRDTPEIKFMMDCPKCQAKKKVR